MIKLDHIGFVVDSIEKYTEVFRGIGLEDITAPVENPLQKVFGSFVNVGGKEDIYVELLEPTGDDSPVSKFLKQRGGGLHHLCFEVEDIEKTSAELAEKGCKMIVSPQDCEAYDINFNRECNSTSKIAFFIVAERFLLELIEKGI